MEMEGEPFFAPERYETEGFVIRTYYPGEGAALSEAVTSSYDHLKRFMPWAKPEQGVVESEMRVRSFRARYLNAEEFVLAIFSPDERTLLGGTGYHLRDMGGLSNRSAEIGMWIRQSAAGQGLGTAVLRALIRWGFSDWPWERLSWRCDASNLASQRTALGAGLSHEATLRKYRLWPDGTRSDILCYAILKEEWQG